MAGMNAGYSNLWRSSPEPTSSLSSSSTTTPAVFKALNTIPGSSKHGNITLSEFIESLGAPSPPSPIPMQNAFRTSTFLADAALIKEFVRVHDEEYAAIVNVVGLTTALTFQPITPRHVRAAENGIGRNVLGLEDAAEKGTLVVTEQSVSWMHAEDRERVQAVQKRIQERMEVWAVERRLHVGWRYLNDADMDQNDAVWEGIGEDNGRFLRAVRERYDKEGVLRRLWVGGFKL